MIFAAAAAMHTAWLLAVVVVATLVSVVTGLQVTFSGHVPTDFPVGPGVFLALDLVSDVSFPYGTSNGPTGFDINDVRFAYDAGTDTGYFGEDGGGGWGW